MISIIRKIAATPAAINRLPRAIAALALAAFVGGVVPSEAHSQTAVAGGPAISLAPYQGTPPDSEEPYYTDGPHLRNSLSKGSYNHSNRTYTANASSSGSEQLNFSYRCNSGGPSPFFCADFSVTVTIVPPPPAEAAAVSTTTSYKTAKTFAGSGTYATSVQIVTQPGHGTASASGMNLTYTPADGWVGSDTFTYRACGAGGCGNPATATVSTTAPAAPIATGGQTSVDYRVPRTFTLPSSGIASSAQIHSGPTRGTLTISGLTATYTSNEGANFDYDQIGYRVTGPGGTSDVAYMNVYLNNPVYPHFPTTPPSFTTAYETPITFTVSNNPNSGGVADYANNSGGPKKGTITWNKLSGTYVPAPGQQGVDTWSYVLCNIAGCGGVAQTISVTIQPPPTPTINGGGSITASFNTPQVFDFAATNATSLELVTAPAHGVVSFSGSVATYTPSTDYIGADTFSAKAKSQYGESAASTVNVTVQPPPIPTVTGGSLRLAFNASGEHDFQPTSGGTLAIVAQPAHGTASISGGRVSYTPNEDFIGTDSIIVTATNLGGTSTQGTVSITVDPPPIPTLTGGSLRLAFNASGSHNFAPTERGVLAISTQPTKGTATINGGQVSYTPNEDFIGTDTLSVTASNLGGTSAPVTLTVTVDPPPIPTITGGSLHLDFNQSGSHDFAPTERGILAIVTQPAHGSATISGGRVTYAPSEDYIGADSFAVTATNLGGTSTPVSVSVTVDPPPIPVISAASVSTPFNRAASYTFNPTDRGQVMIASAPAHGTVTLSGNTINYTPEADFIGTDTLGVTATNLGGTSAPVTLTITVAAPDAPTAANATIATAYETVGSAELVVSGLYRNVAIVAQPTHGSVALAGLTVTYTPAAGYYGPDSFTYEATGFGGSSGPATVDITVARPGAAVAVAKTLTLGHGASGEVTLEATGIFTGFRIVASPANGTVSLAGAVAAYTPKSGFGGQDAFEYVAEGPGGDSVPAKVSITVGHAPPPPPPAAPVVSPPAEVPVSKNGEPVAFALKASSPKATFSISRAPKQGVAAIQGEQATYTPNQGAKGEDVFAVVAKDSTGVQSAPVEFKVALQVAPEEPVKPVAADVSAEVQQGAEVRIAATTGASGGPFEEVVIVQQPASGELRAEGVELVFKAAADFTGDLVAKFALKAKGQTSEAATLSIAVRPIPMIAPKETTAAGGQPAMVSLTTGAQGGPFVAGAVLAISPASAGRAEVLSGEAAQAALNGLAAQSGRASAPAAAEEGDFYLRFHADPKFNGTAVIQYVLTNSGGARVQGVLNVQVRNLPDPSRDPSVRAIVAAQTQAATRFGSAQVSNVNRRLEALHDQQAGKGGVSVSASGGDVMRAEGEPGFNPIRERERVARIPQRLGEEASAEATRPAPIDTGKVWASGAIQFGRSKGREGGQRFDFTTSGLSVGADTQLGSKVLVGAGGGFGREVSDLASDLGQVEARSVSLFAYGSVRPSENLFIDAVVGGSKMDFKNTRTVQATGGEVRGDRSGDQLFGSLSASWNYATPVVRLSPYARFQYVRSTLAAYTEKGDATYGLTFSKLKVDEMNVSAGLRAEYAHRISRGVLLPRVRAELTQILSQTGTSRVSYTGLGDGPTFGIDGTPTGMTSVLGGLGLVWRGDNGWDLSIDVEHSASGSGNGVTSVRVGGSGKF